MFKVKLGRLQAFGQEIPIENGTHNVYYSNGGNLTMTDDGNSTKICSYTSINGVVRSIISDLPQDDQSGELFLTGRSAYTTKKSTNSMLIGQIELSSNFEGMAFDYNYTSFSQIASTANLYEYLGGMVCGYPGGISIGTWYTSRESMYTAVPLRPCGTAEYPLDSNRIRQAYGVSPAGPQILVDSLSTGTSMTAARKYFKHKREYKGYYKCLNISKGM